MGFFNSIKQFLKYCSVALGSAVTDWLVFMALKLMGGPYILCQATSRVTGGVFSFAFNRYWSFSAKNGTHITVQGRRFFLLYFFSYSLSLVLLYFFVDIIHLPVYISKLAADTICFIVNFVVMHNYVYNQRQGLLWATSNVINSIIRRCTK